MDCLPTLPFELLCILAMKMNIACISTWVHQNLHVRKTPWDKTAHIRKATVMCSAWLSLTRLGLWNVMSQALVAGSGSAWLGLGLGWGLKREHKKHVYNGHDENVLNGQINDKLLTYKSGSNITLICVNDVAWLEHQEFPDINQRTMTHWHLPPPHLLALQN